jgi:hypothetical protein
METSVTGPSGSAHFGAVRRALSPTIVVACWPGVAWSKRDDHTLCRPKRQLMGGNLVPMVERS